MCNVLRYIFVGFFLAICSVASCIELSHSSETTLKNNDLKNNEDEASSSVIKRQLLPLPRAGRSNWRPSRSEGLLPLSRAERSEGLLPLPRVGRAGFDTQGIVPMPRAGRSEGLLPLPRAGRSEGLLPMPRSGRSSDQGLVPMPRAGRSDGMLPFPRAGRSDGMLPFPRAGRSEGILPFPRAGRSEGILPFPRAGRSEGMLPFPRTGRSDGQGLVPIPRAGRSSNRGILPMPRTSRSSMGSAEISEEDLYSFPRNGRSTDGLVPMPRAGRSIPPLTTAFDCSDSIECSEMHDLPNENVNDNYENTFLARSKRSLNESSMETKNATVDLVKSVSAKNGNETSFPMLQDESNEFALNGMTIVLKPKSRTNPSPLLVNDDEVYDYDRIGRGLKRHWIEFEKAFSFRYPIPFSSLLSLSPGSPSSNFFSNSLEDEQLESNNVDPIDLQLRAVYIPRIGKRTGSYGLPGFSAAEWLKRNGISGTGPAFQPRIGRSSFFQPRTGRSMNGADDDDLNVEEVILDRAQARSSFTPRIGRSVKSQKQILSNDQKINQAAS